MTDYKLINNENSRRYEFQIDGFIPKIEYILSENGEIYLTHTEVPPALEGKDIASQLVLKVLQDIEHKNLKLVPLCPFIAGYIHNQLFPLRMLLNITCNKRTQRN